MNSFSLSKIRTARQVQAINIWIKGGRKSKAAALRKAGYSEAVVRHPERVFGSQSVQRELEMRGLGRDGFGMPRPPQSEVSEIITKRPYYSFNPLEMTVEQVRELRERLRAVGYDPASLRSIGDEVGSVQMTPYNNLGSADVFGVSVENSLRNMSSM